jgi:hypothetical protein
MDLAFNFLLILLLELPIVGFFFRRKKRNNAILTGFIINIITWPIVNVIRLNTDWNLNMVEIGVVVIEGAAYWFILECTWRKAFLMSIVANAVSFLITKFVYISPDFFTKKPDMIIR